MPVSLDLTLDQWIVAGAALALAAGLGLLIGYLVSLRSLKAKNVSVAELERRQDEVQEQLRRQQSAHESELQALQQSQQSYRGEVHEHFEHTSQLMSQMVDNYRQMYQHLASGAEQLADMREVKKVVAPPPEAITEDNDMQDDSPASEGQTPDSVASSGGQDSESDPDPRSVRI